MLMRSSFCLLLLLMMMMMMSVTNSTGTGNESSQAGEIVRRLLRYYDKTTPPSGPTEVKVSLYFMRFDVLDKVVDMTIYLRQSWRDPRLSFQSTGTLNKIRAYVWDDIWVPDTFFRNEISSTTHDVTVNNRLLRIKSNGDIWYVMKLKMTAPFHMSLQKFPFDTQIFSIFIESFGYTMDTMYLSSMDTPVSFTADIGLLGFSITQTYFQDCSTNYSTGAYPCLETSLKLRRSPGYYIMTIVFPSVVIVALSWSTFFVPASLPTVKLSAALFTALSSLVLEVLGRTAITPVLKEVPYVTVIDIWMTSCLIVVIAALVIQLTVVRCAPTQQQSRHGDLSEGGKLVRGKLNFIAAIVFPVAFLLFTIIFWGVMSL